MAYSRTLVSEFKSSTPTVKVSYLKIAVLGVGYFGISALWATYNAFMPLLLATKFHLAPAVIGFFMALDNLAALFIQPPVGAWSDRLHTRLGRRIPFLLIGAPIAAAAFGLIPFIVLLPLFIACTLTLMLSMAFWRTPFTALIADVTPSPYRSQANGIINAIGVLGAMFAFLGGAALYRLNPAYPFWSGAGLVLLALLLILIGIKEPNIQGKETNGAGLINSLQAILQDPDRSVLRLFLAVFCWFVSNNTIDAFISLYAVNHLKLNESAGAQLLGLFTIAYILFAIPAGLIGSRVGRRISILTGIVMMGACGLAQYLLPVHILVLEFARVPFLGAVPFIGLSLMFSGVGWTLVNINSLPMVMDSGKDFQVGAYLGLFFLFSTLGAIIGPIFNGWVIQMSGSDYRTTMLAGPFFMLAAFVLMLGVRKGEAIGYRGT